MGLELVTSKRGYTYYTLDGRKIPRVTSILDLCDKSNALVPWASRVVAEYSIDVLQKIKNEELTLDDILSLDLKEFIKNAKNRPEEIKKAEGDKGTRVHEFAHRLFRSMLNNEGFDAQIDSDIENPCEALISWVKTHDVRPIYIEEKVVSISISPFAGTLDIVSYVDSELLIIDVKTAKGIYDTMPLQVAAYDFAFREENQTDTDGTGILRLDKETGEPEFVMWDAKETEGHLKEFLHWAKIYNMRVDRKARAKLLKKSLTPIPKNLNKEPF